MITIDQLKTYNNICNNNYNKMLGYLEDAYDENIYTVQEIADALKVTRQTIYKRINKAPRYGVVDFNNDRFEINRRKCGYLYPWEK